MPQSQLYDCDFYAWANEQAALLRAGELNGADVENIAEEIETLARTEKREFVSRLTGLLLHLLQWRFQPGLRSHSWRLSVKLQRMGVESHLADSPSLKTKLEASSVPAWRRALIEAQRETGLDAEVFPKQCPWAFEQMMDSEFWPEG